MIERQQAAWGFGRRPALQGLCMLGLLALLPPAPASAQPVDRHGASHERMGELRDQRRDERFEERRQRRDEARPDRRDEFRDERRRQMEERRERMTPEERRSLRRDLHEANRDLYRRDR